jgi:hypothetical protein
LRERARPSLEPADVSMSGLHRRDPDEP